MKKWLASLVTIFLIGALTACGANNDNTKDEQNEPANNEISKEETETKGDSTDGNTDTGQNDATSTENQTGNMSEKMQNLEFAEFELEIEYTDNKEYEVDIDKKSSGDYTAKLEDEINNHHLKGNEAFNHIYPLMEKMNVTPDSTKEEIIEEVLNAFDLDTNYTDFDVEIIFHDGTKLEYEDKK